MKIILFTKENCPNCPLAKKIVNEIASELNIEIENVNIDENVIEALQFNVASTPAAVLVKENDYEVLFRSEVPSRKELIEMIK